MGAAFQLMVFAAAFVLIAVVFLLISRYYISMGIWDNVSAFTYTSHIMGLGVVFLFAAIPAFFAAKAQVVKQWERINQKQIINDSGILKIAAPLTPQEGVNIPAGGEPVRGVYKESLANYAAFTFSLFFLLMVVILPSNLYLYPFPAIPFLTLGALTGLALGYLSEKRVLGFMEKKGEYKNSVTTFVGLGVCAVLVFYVLPDFLSSYLAVNTVPMTIFFVISLLPVSFAAGAFAVHMWEKKNQKRIVSNSRFLMIDGKLYLTPSPAKQ
jgi:hypothetical protein